ncbi:glycogen debranching enzyme GlgX, partial [Mesorhizobium sp. M1A.T.Ca.IN.004.03.1.1]
KAIVTADIPALVSKPLFNPGGFIYEVAVRPFTILHPDVPEAERGTVAALAHPSVIAHLKRIGVDAVELMPITAWIDER